MANPEKLADLLAKRFEDYNTKVLEELAGVINKFNGLNYTQASKLAQELKYDKSYIDLVDELAKLTGKTKKEIKKILDETVQEHIDFSDVFFKAKKMKTPVYATDKHLQELVSGVAKVSEGDFVNLAKSTGFTFLDENNHLLFYDMKQTYYKVIDECVYAVSQGKETSAGAIRKIIKQLSDSGVRRIVYANDGKKQYTQRIDSAVRRNVLDSISAVARETEIEFGKRFEADGVEITVHENPAPDHQDVQGKQFSINKYSKSGKLIEKGEFEKFQSDEKAVSYDGVVFDPEYDGRDRRSIGQYNCRHDVLSILLGVSKPLYSNEKLQEIKDRANEKIEIDGKEYTRYETTQLQRKIETEIRKSKDRHIMYKKTNDKEGMLEEQHRITQLKRKYYDITNKANIVDTYKQRTSVSGYRPIREPKVIEEIKTSSNKGTEVNTKIELLNKWIKRFKDDNIEVTRMLKADPKLMDEQITQIDSLMDKYKFVKDDIKKGGINKPLIIRANTSEIMGEGNYARNVYSRGERENYIEFNDEYYRDRKKLIGIVETKIKQNWWQEVDKKNYAIYPTTHEFGHLLEFKMMERIGKKAGKKGTFDIYDYMSLDYGIKKEMFKDVPNYESYISEYGKGKENFEWFAETFAKMELGKQTPATKAFKKYIDDFMKQER